MMEIMDSKNKRGAVAAFLAYLTSMALIYVSSSADQFKHIMQFFHVSKIGMKSYQWKWIIIINDDINKLTFTIA